MVLVFACRHEAERCCTTKRHDLQPWLAEGLPEHGVVYSISGLGANGTPAKQVVTLDFARRTLRVVPWVGPATTRGLAAEEVDRIAALADEAWRSPPPKVVDHIDDYLETVIVADRDQVFVVSKADKLEPTRL